MSEDERRRLARTFRDLHAAFVRGDVSAIRQLLDDPQDFPNGLLPFELGMGDTALGYAIYWSPLDMIRELLRAGADVNYEDSCGFPSLISALESDRADKHELIVTLIDAGANIGQRGLNDWTPLHIAVHRDDPELVRLLLQHGVDPTARTRIDDYATPEEEAVAFAKDKALEALRRPNPRTR